MRFLASFILFYWFQNSLKNWPTDSNRKKSVCLKKNCFLFELVKNIVKKKILTDLTLKKNSWCELTGIWIKFIQTYPFS